MNSLALSAYAKSIGLDQPYCAPSLKSSDKQHLIESLYLELLSRFDTRGITDIYQWKNLTKRECIDAVITMIEPNSLTDSVVEQLNQLLELEKHERDITFVSELIHAPFLSIGDTKLILRQGDITLLGCDAIVNAANSQLLGCFKPFHHCIDNAIHSRAGVQLRADCNTIIQIQGNPEPTGQAKITRAYNLPSRYVLHTVGPIVTGSVTDTHKSQLTDCYRNIMSLAQQKADIRSLAFCSISTGVFGFPIEKAAPLAIEAVTQYLHQNPSQFEVVLFNVFSEHDYLIYQAALEEYTCNH
ncbi:protein-ADP-ribose hydrolase [Gynuella sunshinyii]|uniref:Putative phosphatase, C-terminal domain of histone macroH2A1-like protein n=1 Tax=Gynuella sunshinyii YC6258 TaxID=1445510 RepID=A0A0C5VN06_9GAMM|nr:protein-ADP-ribose hydrolase [Gynuella sunshinyii]AJQ95686.1 putative phosphatase, C-terminal domain of histone macroH2A1-like protein [Gynuella sunshinyii YC6258]